MNKSKKVIQVLKSTNESPGKGSVGLYKWGTVYRSAVTKSRKMQRCFTHDFLITTTRNFLIVI